MPARQLRAAICGLGRIGKYHSMNIIEKVASIDLIAACSIAEADLVWAKEHLVPLGVTIYKSYEEMLEHPGIEAVIIASSTSGHADQTIKAIEKGYHVLCEKPLATEVADAEKVVQVAKKHPDIKVLCGFSRRFDASYQDAKKKVDEGFVGKATVFRSQTCDKRDETGFFVEYGLKSGGIFVDCSVHDIDLCVYFYGADAVPKSIFAVGNCSIHPELAQNNDSDNALGVIQFHDGRIANFYASRMMAHGQEDTTEIIGTEGKIAVNKNPSVNLNVLYDKTGARFEVPQDFWARFNAAFVTELSSFASWVLNDQPIPFSLEANVKVLVWAKYLQQSLSTGKALYFDESGKLLE